MKGKPHQVEFIFKMADTWYNIKPVYLLFDLALCHVSFAKFYGIYLKNINIPMLNFII